MKEKIFVILVLALFIFMAGCAENGDEDETEKTGTLIFKTLIAETTRGSQTRSVTNTCNIVNMKATHYKIEVSSGEINEGDIDEFEWVEIYASEEEKELIDFRFEFQLEPGYYNNMRFTMKNRIYWICDFNGTNMTFPDLQNSDLPPETVMSPSVNNAQGGWYYDDDDKFTLGSDEKMGGFDIKEGEITEVTNKFNIKSFEWIDNNENGEYEKDIDKLDNWTLVDGTELMTEYIISYK